MRRSSTTITGGASDGRTDVRIESVNGLRMQPWCSSAIPPRSSHAPRCRPVQSVSPTAFSAARISACRLAICSPIGGPPNRRRSRPNHTAAVTPRKPRVIHRVLCIGRLDADHEDQDHRQDRQHRRRGGRRRGRCPTAPSCPTSAAPGEQPSVIGTVKEMKRKITVTERRWYISRCRQRRRETSPRRRGPRGSPRSRSPPPACGSSGLTFSSDRRAGQAAVAREGEDHPRGRGHRGKAAQVLRDEDDEVEEPLQRSRFISWSMVQKKRSSPAPPPSMSGIMRTNGQGTASRRAPTRRPSTPSPAARCGRLSASPPRCGPRRLTGDGVDRQQQAEQEYAGVRYPVRRFRPPRPRSS